MAVYFEAAAVITVLVLLGQVLELRARDKTSGAIRALLGLAPKTARRVPRDGTEEDVDIEHIAVAILRVRPGEKVPVDGVVTEGHVSIDESMVTGESMPVSKEPGSKVIGGTLNSSGSFIMRAENVGREPCWRASCRWWRTPSAAAHRSSGWPTRFPAGSCRS